MKYYCYLIQNEKEKTYIGITNNLENRLNTHNGLNNKKRSRSKCTRMDKSLWFYHTVVGIFSSRGKAQRFEWYWKHIKNKSGKWIRNYSGINKKMNRLLELLMKEEWKYINIVY